MKWIGNLLEFLAKQALALWVVLLFLLNVPEQTASDLGLSVLRQTYRGYLWLGFIFTSVLVFRNVFLFGHQKLFEPWAKRRRERAQHTEIKRLRAKTISDRLSSLSEEERMWMICCLAGNQQTLIASLANPTAQSLVQKGLASAANGNILRLPYSLSDDVWDYLKEHEVDFLDRSKISDLDLRAKIAKFRKSLSQPY